MDFAKEFEVKIEVLEKDWCEDDVEDSKTDQAVFEDISVDDKQLINIARCPYCNELFIDSHSLFKHNLSHLFVTLEILPNKILDFYDRPEEPAIDSYVIFKETQNISESLVKDNNIIPKKEDLSESSFQNKTNVTIKCEIIENDSECLETDKISEKDTNVDLLAEDNNNYIPKTKRMHKCDICSKVYTYKHWHAHMNEVHSTIPIECKFCKKVYKSKKSLRKHSCSANPKEKKIYRKKKVTEKQIAIFNCSQCPSVFYSKDCMQKHVKNVHSKPVNCDICHSRLNSHMYLASHIRRVHYDDGKVHSCDLCGKIFKSPNYVKVHMKNSHSSKSKRGSVKIM